MDFRRLSKTKRLLSRLLFLIVFACFPFVFSVSSACFAKIAGWFRLLCAFLAVALRFLSKRVPAALRLFSGCWRLLSGCVSLGVRLLFVCCPLAFSLLSDCFLMAFRLLSDCFLFAFQCLSADVPAVFRLLPSCFPIAVVCWLTAICFAAARRLLTSFHADPFQLIHACCQRAVSWHSGLYPVADRLLAGRMPQLSPASNIVYARDGLKPTNRCTRHAVRSCVRPFATAGALPSGFAGACVAWL